MSSLTIYAPFAPIWRGRGWCCFCCEALLLIGSIGVWDDDIVWITTTAAGYDDEYWYWRAAFCFYFFYATSLRERFSLQKEFLTTSVLYHAVVAALGFVLGLRCSSFKEAAAAPERCALLLLLSKIVSWRRPCLEVLLKPTLGTNWYSSTCGLVPFVPKVGQYSVSPRRLSLLFQALQYFWTLGTASDLPFGNSYE